MKRESTRESTLTARLQRASSLRYDCFFIFEYFANQSRRLLYAQAQFRALSDSSLDAADDKNAHADDEEAGMIEARALSISLCAHAPPPPTRKTRITRRVFVC